MIRLYVWNDKKVRASFLQKVEFPLFSSRQQVREAYSEPC